MNKEEKALLRAVMPTQTNNILSRRTLRGDFKRLEDVLESGQNVLDVGCGTGAITVGIAERVGLHGTVHGIDINPRLVNDAKLAHGSHNGLIFLVANILDFPYDQQFDLVVSSRVLQWLSDPRRALKAMMQATKPGGKVIVLDYNHTKLQWSPTASLSLTFFHDKYLAWRSDAGMDNEIADHLAELFQQTGLENITVIPHHETTKRGDEDFFEQIKIKVEVAASRGHQLVDEGWLTEEQRACAEHEGRDWIKHVAHSQTLYLLCVEGTRPLI